VIAGAILANPMPVLAWSQLDNDYDQGGSGYCGGSTTYPCFFWQEAHNTSITLYSYFDPSVDNDSYSFTTAINRAFGDFNAAPAYNPYTYQCVNRVGCGTNAYFGASLGCLVYGQTTFPILGAIEHSTSVGYYRFIREAYVYFNTSSAAHWNNSVYWAYNGITCVFNADGRKVSTHETGHLMALGHTGYVAVMHQGPESYYALQINDIQGLEAIYSGSSPSS
jgi:Matrixin